jgi:hypothetical protein
MSGTDPDARAVLGSRKHRFCSSLCLKLKGNQLIKFVVYFLMVTEFLHG